MATRLRWTTVGSLCGLVLLACGAEDSPGSKGGGTGASNGSGGSSNGKGGSGGGSGGSVSGTGGTASGAGGSSSGAGGSSSGSGGSSSGSGGSSSGAGGVGGSVGGAGGSGLGECDGRMENSMNPIRQACGSFISPFPAPGGTKIQLGPYGAKMDDNVGKGFETGCGDDSATCVGFVGLFDAAPNEPMTNQLLDVGKQPCTHSTPNTGTCLNFGLFSTYYPAVWPSGTIPVLAWGNGTCAQPEGYGALLRYVASYGFFIVAPNCREVGNGAAMRKGLDFAAAANADSASPYFGHLDMSKVGLMGHSQGSSATAQAATDSRVKAVILFNGGFTASKPFAVFTGTGDITATTPQALQTNVNAASKGSFFYYYNPVGAPQFGITGHLPVMLSPQRVTDQATSWWQAVLNNDAAAIAKFSGTSCAFCGHTPADYAFGQKGF